MSSPGGPGPDPTVAAAWIERWDAQQARYATARAQRDEVILALIGEVVADRDDPVVVEVGCGPGTLTRRIAASFPEADAVGVDADPLLIGLARAVDGGGRFVQVRVGAEVWQEALGRSGGVDAIVSSAVVHYLPADDLGSFYTDLLGLLRPGGLLITADDFAPVEPELGPLQNAVAEALVAGTPPDVGTWAGWWQAAAADPALRALRRATAAGAGTEEDAPIAPELGGDHMCDLSLHESLLQVAGARAVGPVWQIGRASVVVAVR